MDESNTTFQKVSFVTITEQSDGQRIDNFLMRELDGVPRSYVYKILRKGEVRVDKKRVKPKRKLALGEVVRIPPMRIEEKRDKGLASDHLLAQVEAALLLEDDDIIIMNKPAGLPVHGGSGFAFGLIEVFRQLRPNLPYVELAHRLDKDTSGLIVLAKTRQALQALHAMFKKGGIDKRYLTLVSGKWHGGERCVQNELVKKQGSREKMQVSDGRSPQNMGEKAGKKAESLFKARKHYEGLTLMEVKLMTGRMHQIRTQFAHLDMPVLGDDRYGDFPLNRHYKKTIGLKRLFLHSYYVDFTLEFSGQRYHLEIPLADDLQQALDKHVSNT